MGDRIIKIPDDYNPRNPHGGNKISSISVSPGGKYVITYSYVDNSIEGWIVEDSKMILDPQANVYKLPKGIKTYSNYSIKIKLSGRIVGISIDVDKENIWAISLNYLFQLDLETLQLKFSYSLGFNTIYKNIFDNKLSVIFKENSIVVKYNNEIAIFSEGIYFPIRNIRLEDFILKVELLCEVCEGQNNNYLLVFNLPKYDEKQNIFLYHTSDINKQPVDASEIFNDGNSEKGFIIHEYNSESKKAFGLVDGKISCINLSNRNWHEFFINHMFDDIITSWNNYLNDSDEMKYCNDTLFFPDMENIRSLFSEEKKNLYESEHIDISFKDQKYKWRINNINNRDYKISVYLDEILLDSRKIYLLDKWKILINNALILNYDRKLIIFEYDNNNKSIKTKYWCSTFGEISITQFSGSTLPMTVDQRHAEWKKMFISIIEDNRCLARYGTTILRDLIKSNDSESTHNIESIYTRCIEIVKEDPSRNLKFLSIITSSMDDLYRKYPDYLTKFNSEMFMFLDPYDEKINNNKKYSHFYTFSQEIEIYKTSKLTKLSELFILSELYCKLQELIEKLHDSHITIIILVYLLFLPFMIIWHAYDYLIYYLNYKHKSKQHIVLIVPYINHSCYPLEYASWLDKIFYPQYSEFINTCEKEFYTNWNGEAIINFKWKTFGRAYYFVIWFIFIIFLVCFTVASYPTNYISQELRIMLYQTSIAFGIFHIIFELRQFIWSPKKYFLSIWNLFDSLNAPNSSDPNNPWTLSNTYNQTDETGNVKNEAFIQVPSGNTNLFYSYPTSLLAIYLFLTGNQNSLSPWAPTPSYENTILYILMIIFSFLIVIYLMNLFIGLLNMAIEKDNDRASYLTLKAEFIAEIELFYLLPHQRRWKAWFPEIIYYTVDVKKARIYIKEAINRGDWKKDDWPEMKNKILKLLGIEDAIKD
ncbi:hypothetical protein C1645_856790 [Glomus cerebriforme]|uniref:Ion transport domain-containing protein n=1 Tax=Glomus cerebriforme TaxID=658196 RepID=A0A397SNB5_9GLOM|nr:hypothetical protein C1645_856790 [Glomus cerebriforme]